MDKLGALALVLVTLLPVANATWMADSYWNGRYSGHPGYTDYDSGGNSWIFSHLLSIEYTKILCYFEPSLVGLLEDILIIILYVFGRQMILTMVCGLTFPPWMTLTCKLHQITVESLVQDARVMRKRIIFTHVQDPLCTWQTLFKPDSMNPGWNLRIPCTFHLSEWKYPVFQISQGICLHQHNFCHLPKPLCCDRHVSMPLLPPIGMKLKWICSPWHYPLPLCGLYFAEQS